MGACLKTLYLGTPSTKVLFSSWGNCPLRCGRASQASCMEVIPKIFGVLTQGIHSKWWGLACPAHCFSFSLPIVLASIGFGITLTFLFTLFLIWTVLAPSFGFHLAPAASVPPSGLDRARACVHESWRSQKVQRLRGGG